MERVANIIIRQSLILLPDDVDGQNSTKDLNVDKLSSAATATTNTTLIHYGSHATGGLLGGSIVGFLFQGKPMAGAILLTPMMLVVGKIEASVDDYRTERLQQLLMDQHLLREQDKRGP
jgi:hypothetical protein